MVEEAREPVVVAAHVEQPERLGVQAELIPGVDLEQLLERPHAAGQRHERVRELGHQRLALVHRVDHPQIGQPGVRDLAVDQRLRDHADHAAAALQRRVGDGAHQTDARAAVDELDATLREPVAEIDRGGAIRDVRPRAGPGEDADLLHARQRILPRLPGYAPPEIFKAYDVRGLYGEQIDGDVAEGVGRAFARVLADLAGKPASELRVGLGRDMRLTAPELAARYRAGLTAEGAHVLDAGMVGTEMLYYLVGSRELDGGLMCTASHNPKAYTGAKLVERGAVALSGDRGIGDIARLLAGGLPERPARPPGGSSEDVDVYAEFQEAALRFIDASAVRPLKVVLDGGNGMAGPMVGPILERLDGLELVPTYWEPDGAFPGHEPNPLLPENREFIIRKVREEGADLGIAWDGDGDRCFFIDETGEFVAGDFLTALLAESILQKRPGAEILYDIRASRAVPDTVQAAGGRALVNRVGHAFFKTRMRDEGGAFGGEVSGHYYFADFYNADSGTIPALLILELLGQKGT